MTDRELLELAAKAAGIEIVGDVDRYVAQPDHFAGGLVIRNDRGGDSLWNPLTDDGDALRLAVKLRLLILPSIDGEIIIVVSYTDIDEATENARHDPRAATRRAIVCVAAKIGRGKP